VGCDVPVNNKTPVVISSILKPVGHEFFELGLSGVLIWVGCMCVRL
jgi:hypothetical protein